LRRLWKDMKKMFQFSVSTRDEFGKIQFNYSNFFIVVALLAAGQFLHATDLKKPCAISADNYLVIESNLEYVNVSRSYAESIYSGVRDILTGFLSYGEDYCLFHDSGQKEDLTDHVKNRLLDLHCEVKRVSGNVLLLVQIDVYETHENLLSFESTAPFFRPSSALYDFPEAFQRAFSGRVVRNYVYPFSPDEFHLGFDDSELYFMKNSIWDIADLEKDLQLTDGVPADVLQSVHSYRVTKNTWQGIGMATTLVGALTYLGTTVPILILDGFNDPDRVPTGVWAANVAGLFIMALIGPMVLEVPSPSKKLIQILNGWCCADMQ
jgi:hypothetical protein